MTIFAIEKPKAPTQSFPVVHAGYLSRRLDGRVATPCFRDVRCVARGWRHRFESMKKYAYLTPEAALLSIEVEQGFVTSSPDFNGTTPDYDEDNNE